MSQDIITAAMMQKNIPTCGECPFMYAHCFEYTIYGSKECIENLKRHQHGLKEENTWPIRST